MEEFNRRRLEGQRRTKVCKIDIPEVENLNKGVVQMFRVSIKFQLPLDSLIQDLRKGSKVLGFRLLLSHAPSQQTRGQMFPEGSGMSRPETKGSAGLRAGCKHHNFRTGTKSTVGGRKVLMLLPRVQRPSRPITSPRLLQNHSRCFLCVQMGVGGQRSVQQQPTESKLWGPVLLAPVLGEHIKSQKNVFNSNFNSKALGRNSDSSRGPR